MKTSILILSLALATSAYAEKHDHGHEHGKHVHGAGKMDIAFDGLKGEIDFEISADAILGSEKSPKTDAEKKAEAQKIDDLILKFKESIEIKGANCQWSNVKAEVNRHKMGKVEHADIDLEADLACEKDIKGFTLDVNLSKHYKGLNKIEVQINANGLQKGGVIDGKTSSIDLK